MKPFLIVAILGALTAATQAQTVIFTETFNSGLGPGASISGYAFGDSVSQTRGIVPFNGTGGTPCLEQTNNTANLGNGYAGAAIQLQEGQVSGNTSINLSDYVLEFEAGASAGSLQLQIQTWSGTGFGGVMSGTLSTAPNPPGFGNDLAVPFLLQHYTLNLGNLAIFPDQGTFSPLGGTWQIAFQHNGGANGTPSWLSLRIDNVTLTMVPEPSTFALAGLGGAAMMFIRRRRK